MRNAPSLRQAAHVALIALGLGVATFAAPFAQAQEAPIVQEKSPPGDIPDDQLFVTYKSPLGFSLKIPEGWARTDAANGVSFADRYGQIAVLVKPASAAPTVVSVRANEAAELEKAGRAIKISSVSEVKLPAGSAVKIVYTSNSEPNAVTNKQIRLESERFLIMHGDKIAALTFSSPAGADNADQWTLMSQSFGWQ